MRLPPGLSVRPGQDAPVIEIWRRENAATLLFYPGTMLAPGHYRTLIAALWQMGLTVAGLHLSGHGHCKSDNDFTFSQLLGQGLIAETWLWRNGLGPVAICGHSQGGILALAHAGTSHTACGAFAISAAFPNMPAAIGLTRFWRLARHREKLLAILTKLAAIAPKFPAFLPMYLNLGRITAGARKPLYMGKAKGRLFYPLKYLVSLFSATPGTRLNCPFWLFNARNDELFTETLIRETFALIRAPEKRLIWLEGGGHMAPLNPHLARFIAAHIAAAASGIGMRVNCRREKGIGI